MPARSRGTAVAMGSTSRRCAMVATTRVTAFGGLRISFDDRVLEPRQWTTCQSRWAAELLRHSPPGPVLELCAGVGHIGLLAVSQHPRELVLVDADQTACDYARRNVHANRPARPVDVRLGRVDEAVHPDERFAGIIADPPWVASGDVGRFPHDPLTAIGAAVDGGERVVRKSPDVAARHPRGVSDYPREALIRVHGLVDPTQAYVDRAGGPVGVHVPAGVVARRLIRVDQDEFAGMLADREQTDVANTRAQLEYRPRRAVPEELGGPPGLTRGPLPWFEHSIVEADPQPAERRDPRRCHHCAPSARTTHCDRGTPRACGHVSTSADARH